MKDTDAKDLILLRGLPGSGKSGLAGLLSENGKYPVFCIDDYFTDESGHYSFVHNENHLAYSLCRENTEKAMREGRERIFVENVFSMEWEMEPYFRLASEHGYRVHVLTVENRHGGKNVHGVTPEQIRKMAEKYKVVLY